MRKTAGFEIADYIETYFVADDYVNEVFAGFAAYIKHETLSREIFAQAPPEGAASEKFKLEGHEFTLGILKKP